MSITKEITKKRVINAKINGSLYLTLSIFMMFLVGCGEEMKIDSVARFYIEGEEFLPNDWSNTVRMPVSGLEFKVFPKPVLTEGDIADVALLEGDTGAGIGFILTPHGKKKLYQLTAGNHGRGMVLLINEIPIGFHRIERAIESGEISIYLELDDEETEEIYNSLKVSTATIQELKK